MRLGQYFQNIVFVFLAFNAFFSHPASAASLESKQDIEAQQKVEQLILESAQQLNIKMQSATPPSESEIAQYIKKISQELLKTQPDVGSNPLVLAEAKKNLNKMNWQSIGKFFKGNFQKLQSQSRLQGITTLLGYVAGDLTNYSLQAYFISQKDFLTAGIIASSQLNWIGFTAGIKTAGLLDDLNKKAIYSPKQLEEIKNQRQEIHEAWALQRHSDVLVPITRGDEKKLYALSREPNFLTKVWRTFKPSPSLTWSRFQNWAKAQNMRTPFIEELNKRKGIPDTLKTAIAMNIISNGPNVLLRHRMEDEFEEFRAEVHDTLLHNSERTNELSDWAAGFKNAQTPQDFLALMAEAPADAPAFVVSKIWREVALPELASRQSQMPNSSFQGLVRDWYRMDAEIRKKEAHDSKKNISWQDFRTTFNNYISTHISTCSEIGCDLPSRPRVVIFWAPYGNGHKSAADGIIADIRRIYPEIQAEDITHHTLNEEDLIQSNINDYRSILMDKVSGFFFKYSSQLFPAGYDTWYRTYHGGVAKHKDLNKTQGASDYKLDNLSRYLDAVRPTVIVSTFAHATEALAVLKAKGAIPKEVPIAWTMTDYVRHPYNEVIGANIDMTFLPHPVIEEEWNKHAAVPKEKYMTAGMAVNPLFKKEMTEADRLEFLNLKELDPKVPIVTIISGANANGDFPGMIRSIAENTQDPVQIVAICAKNKNCFEQVTKLKENLPSHVKVKVEGFVSNVDVANYLKSSKVFITKAGGLTSTEVLTAGTNVIFLDNNGGQERFNIELFEENGLGLSARQAHEIGPKVKALLLSGDTPDQNGRTMVERQRAFMAPLKPERMGEYVAKKLIDTDPKVLQKYKPLTTARSPVDKIFGGIYKACDTIFGL